MEAEAENVKTGMEWNEDHLISKSPGSWPSVLLYVRQVLVSLTMINASANSSNNDT